MAEPGSEHLTDVVRRARWRLRGAWEAPTFVLATVAGAVLMHLLPIAGDSTGLLEAFLLCGFMNLALVAVVAPLGGRLVRRRRPDLPPSVAVDRAGTTVMALALVVLLGTGIAHHGAVMDSHEAAARQLKAVRSYVLAHGEEQYKRHLDDVVTARENDFLFRSCVPGDDPRRSLCLFVDTSHGGAKVAVDSDQRPNSAFEGIG